VCRAGRIRPGEAHALLLLAALPELQSIAPALPGTIGHYFAAESHKNKVPVSAD
jgi:hypothetical protein